MIRRVSFDRCSSRWPRLGRRGVAAILLVGGLGCGSTLIDDQAPSHLLVLSCAPEQLACNGSCLTCAPPANAQAVCAPAGCGFACDAGFNQCGPSACVAESPTSCGASCEDCSGKVPPDAVAICNGAHQCDFECQPGFLRSGSSCRRAVAVSAGFEHSCAITTDGRVKCWGSNEFGQLGNLTVVSSPIPVDPVLPAPAQAVAAGYYHTCAVVSGQVYCWGNGTLGELGNGAMASSAAPVLVPGLSGIEKISAGGEGDPGFVNVYAHTCAISRGIAWCWGSNGSGQLGDGTTATRSTPVRVSILPPQVVVSSIAIGERHTCALTDDGAVYCWGANDSGQLGVGGQSAQSYPARPTIASGAVSVTAGEAHTCALVGRKVRCWGLNGSFQVDPDGKPESYPEGIEPITGGVRPTNVAAGRYHTCVLDATASAQNVCCFGSNRSDQLGSEDQTLREFDVLLDRREQGVAISAGAAHTCVLTSGGGIQCWGENAEGQLGNGSSGGSSAAPTYVSGR